MIAMQSCGPRLQQAYAFFLPSLPHAIGCFAKNTVAGLGIFTAAAFLGLDRRDDAGLTMGMAAALGTSIWGAARSICLPGGLFKHAIDGVEAASLAYLGGPLGYSVGDHHGRGSGALRGAVLGTLGAVVV
ncbi:MAG: hypothetical protein EOO77_08420, partial [Oxalobacteraceae bacterium]